MQRDTYSDIAHQNHITGICYPFVEEFAQRQQNVKLMNPNQIYPGGATPQAHAILTKELVLTYKDTESEFGERGFTSLSGMPCTNLELEKRKLSIVGFAAPKDPSSNADEDFTVIKAGTYTVVNGPRPVQAGDLITFEMPARDNLPQSTNGTPKDKVLPQLVPFSHTDTHLQTRQIRASMRSEDPDFGIAHLTIDYLYADPADDMPISAIQEEALGITFGEMIKTARVIESVNGRDKAIEFLETIGLFDEERSQMQQEALDNAVEAMFTEPEGNPDANASENEKGYYKYGGDGYNLAQDARNAAFMARTSHIVGKALNGAKPYDDLDLNIGDVRVTY